MAKGMAAFFTFAAVIGQMDARIRVAGIGLGLPGVAIG